MKSIKFVTLLILLLLPLSVMAQARFATVDVERVFGAMPEKPFAEAQLKSLSDKYQEEYKVLQGEFNRKYAEFQAIQEDASMPQTIKDLRMREILSDNAKIEQLLNARDADLQRAKQELETPIYDKIREVVKQVSDERGYSLVFDVSTTPVAYAGADVDDITVEVLKRLGLNP